MPISPRSHLAYDRAGPTGGTPVVLLHAGVADRRMWDPQWPGLTSEREVIRLDLRGFGESVAKPTGAWSAYGDVLATLDDLDVDRAHLVGCSLGAGVAVEVALARPTLASSLLLVAPGGALIPERTAELSAFIAAEDEAAERGDLDAAAQANVDWWLVSPRRTADDLPADVRQAVHRMQRRAFEVSSDWDDVAELEEELEPPAEGRYADVSAPTLVLLGELDLDAIHQAASAVTAGIPGARLVTWPGTAHLPSMERPAEFSDLVLDWIAADEG